MAQWSLLYGNEELLLTGRNPYDLVSVQGIGGAPVRRLTERSPLQDGDLDIGRRLDSRLINMVLFFSAATRAAADGHRDRLYHWLKPRTGALALRCVRDDGQERRIDVHPLGTVDAPVTDEDRMWAAQKLGVQLRAPDPIWYDPNPQAWGLLGGVGTGNRGWAVPMAVPWVQSVQTYIDTTRALGYTGTWDEYPVITIFGPASDVTIENVTTGDVLDFPALSLAVGQWITVDLRYGRKTVTNQANQNVIGLLSNDSDLATWRLAADPDAPGGENLIRLRVAAAAANETGMQLAFYRRYFGL